MNYLLDDLVGLALRCRDGMPAGEVLGFVLDEGDWALRYVRVHVIGDRGTTVRLLPSAAFPPVRCLDGRLVACLSAGELARGTRVDGSCETISPAAERALHERLHWLPYWGRGDGPVAGHLHDPLHAVGAPLTCHGETPGRVEALLVDTAAWQVTAMRVETADGNRVQVPIGFLERADWTAPAFDADVRAAALAASPEAASTSPPPLGALRRRMQPRDE